MKIDDTPYTCKYRHLPPGGAFIVGATLYLKGVRVLDDPRKVTHYFIDLLKGIVLETDDIDMLVKPIDAEVKILGGVTKYEN